MSNNKAMESMLTLVALCISTLILGGMAFLILKKLADVIDMQRSVFKITEREQHVALQENKVLLSMLGTELRANRSKLEAYTIIYQETLTDLKNTQKEPQYRKLGDMIQMQPSLSREVYNKNTNKISALNESLAQQLVEFYTHLPEETQYKDVEPDADVFDVVNLVESALESAKTIKPALDKLIEDIDNKYNRSEALD